MKSKMSKKLIAFILCMVLVICNSVSILADTPAPETATVEKQVKETKTANDKKASDDEAGDTENVSPQSEESAPEVKTTEKKEETTEATTQKKDEADEVTTKAKEETEKADETTTEAKETTKKEETTETQEEKTTKAKEETSETSGKKDTEKTTEAEEKTAPTELTYEDENVTVTVSAVAKGAIPEGAELKVVPILKDDADTKTQYAEVEQKIQEKAAETETEIKGFLAYDITFVDEDGNEIEPNSEVKVSIEYKNSATPAGTEENISDANITVMHLEENTDGQVKDVVDMSENNQLKQVDTTEKNAIQKTEFVTKSFSVFTITWTYKSGSSLKIKAHYGYMEGDSFIEFEESQNYEGQNESMSINWGSYYSNRTIDLQYYADRLGTVTESYWLTTIKILSATGTEANYLKVERINNGTLFNPKYVYKLQSSINGYYNDVDGFTNMTGDQTIDVYYIFNLNPPGVTVNGHYGYLDGDNFVEFTTTEGGSTTKKLLTLRFDRYQNSTTDLYNYQDDWSDITNEEYRFLGTSLKTAKGQDAQYIKLSRSSNNSNRRYSIQSSVDSNTFSDLEGYTNMSSGESKTLDVYYVFEKVDNGGSGGQGGTIEYPRELTKYKRAVRNDDGTYDLTLSISGTTGTIDNKTKIDVMMVLDVSGSMKDTVEGNEDSKIIKSAEAIDVLVDSLDQDTIDARYNIVTFGTSSEVLTGWSWDAEKVKASVNAEAEAIDHAGDSYSQGTNYEAGMVTAQAQMARARANAMQVIVFLTDGQPTYYINDNNSVAGKGFETSINTLNNTLNAASNLSASKLYVIGLDMKDNIAVYDNDNQYYDGDLYHGWDEFEHYINASIDTDDLLQWICDASGIEGAKKYNETNPNNLANIFGNIAGEVATIACKNVTVIDRLSQYAEPIGDNPTLWIKLYGKGENGQFDFSNPLTTVEGLTPTLDYVNSDTGNVLDVKATYTDGTITLVFPNEYELNPDYTYEVGMKIQPTDKAYEDYRTGYTNTGETDTGTHSNQAGFYSNDIAQVTYDYTEDSVEKPEPEDFPKPVIQVSETTASDNPYILVKKTFKGLSFEQIEGLYDAFTLIVQKKSDSSDQKVLYLSDENVIVSPAVSDKTAIQDYTFTWKVEDCTTGTYTVSESGEEVGDYEVTTEGTGNEVEVSEGTWTFGDSDIQVENANNEMSFTIGDNKIVMASLPSNGYLIWTNERLTSAQRAVIMNAINTNDKFKELYTQGGANNNNCHFYYGNSIEQGISFGKGTISYIPPSGGNTEGKLLFGNKSAWNKVALGSYTMTSAQNADIAVTNTYTAQLDLKKVSAAKDSPEINGAKFKLTKWNGSAWESVMTDLDNFKVLNTDKVELSGLIPGTVYKLEEIEAPEAHMLLGESIYFTVEDGTVKLCNENGVTNSGAGTDEMWSLNQGGNVAILTIKNNILYDLPSAGGPGIYWYTLSGTLLMAGAALIVYREKRKREVLLRK